VVKQFGIDLKALGLELSLNILFGTDILLLPIKELPL
jgi:hypothetical protein